MRSQAINLLRNLRAGVRLAFFVRVSRLAFRIDIAQLLLLFAVSALLDFAGDWIRYGPDPYFSPFGLGGEAFAAAVMMLTSAVLALMYRQPGLVLAIPVVVLAGYPYVQIAHMGLAAALRWTALPNAISTSVDWAIVIWAIVLFIRAVAVALHGSGVQLVTRAIIGGLL